MRRHLSLILGVIFVVLGVGAVPFVYYLSLLQKTPVVDRALEPDMLYALAIPGIIVELDREAGIRSVDSTVLQLDRKDLNFMLQTTVRPDELKNKALDVHRSIVDHVQVGPPDTFSFSISIKDELPTFQQNLLRVFRRKMISRRECSMGQFLGIAWRSVGKIFGVKPPSPEEQLRRLPPCRPPRMVQNSVLEAIQARMTRAQANAPDSLMVRPAFGPKTHRFVRRALQVGQSGPRYFVLLPLLLVGITLMSWKDRPALWARLAAPLLITGLLLLLINLPLFYFWHHMDLFTTVQKVDPDYRMSESTGQWLQVVFYLLREVMKVTARHVALAAAFSLLAGLVFVRQHQAGRRRLASQIDTASSGELGSAPIPALPTALPQDDANAASRAVR